MFEILSKFAVCKNSKNLSNTRVFRCQYIIKEEIGLGLRSAD